MGRADGVDREGERRSLRDRTRKREKERQSGGRKLNVPEGVNYWKKPESVETKSLLDFIPYVVTAKGLGYAEPGELWWEKTFWTHWGVGGGNGSVVCPSTIGKKCPICEHVAELKKQPKTAETDKIIGSIKAKERQIFNVIDRKAPDKGIQIYEDAYFNFGKELKKELDDPENEDKAGFAELKHGFTVKVRWDSEKSGGDSSKNYMKAGAISFIERDEPLSSKLSEKSVDLDKALVIPTYEELLRLFNGAEEEDEEKLEKPKASADEDEDEDAPPPKKSARRDPNEDEDEDTPPPRKPKKPADEEDDDEDEEPEDEEDPDDEDDDPPPRRGKR